MIQSLWRFLKKLKIGFASLTTEVSEILKGTTLNRGLFLKLWLSRGKLSFSTL